MTEVTLPRHVANAILAHALHEEGEVCGLVAARAGLPTTVYPVANRAADRARRFSMDPAGQIEAMRRMREAGETLFAIYHSHPTTAPQPSAADLAEAAYPEALYLIVSRGTRGLLEMQGFRLTDGAFTPLELVMD